MTTSAIAAGPLLLDSMLPEFRFTRLESVAVAADLGAVYGAARELDLLSVHSPLFDALMWARGLADRARHRMPLPPPTMRVADLFDSAAKDEQPWVGLGEDPGRELAVGAIGKVWKPTIEWLSVTPGDFPAFAEPGWAKIAAAFVVHPYGEHRSLLTYEARTACTDAETTERFARYWALASAGAGLVLRETLRTVRTAAESRARSAFPCGGAG
jgi:hypothetical protein